MSYSEGHPVRQPSLLPLSSRTLHHPSFMPLYMTAGFGRHRTDCSDQTVHPIIPSEFFYTDPSMSWGSRVPNIVSDLRVFDCFQLNTPLPVMSACPAPPTRPDPFRSGPPHPIRDLGSLTLKPHLHPPVQRSRVIVQLTPDEDQAITNLLKLHHQEPTQRDETLPSEFLRSQRTDSAPAEEAYKPLVDGDVHCQREASFQLQQGKCWSDTELEAANTLSCFSLMEDDEIWHQSLKKSAVTHPDREDSPISTETRQGSESDCTQNDDISFSCSREHGEPGPGDSEFEEGDVYLPVSESSLWRGASGDLSLWMLSELEGNAVHVLLSLRDTAALDAVP